MKFKLFKTLQYFLGPILLVIFGVFFYTKQQKKFSKILEKPIYSITQITSKIHNNRYEDTFRYQFIFLEEKFESGLGESSSNNLFVGKRYFVIFEESDPDNSMLIPFLFVPDSITKAPNEGWKEPPVSIDKNQIKTFLENY